MGKRQPGGRRNGGGSKEGPWQKDFFVGVKVVDKGDEGSVPISCDDDLLPGGCVAFTTTGNRCNLVGCACYRDGVVAISLEGWEVTRILPARLQAAHHLAG